MDPLRVAVVGAGPAGLYAADALSRSGRPVRVDVLDRLPTPYGLVRYGVAPDHPKIKSIAATLAHVLEHPAVDFVGGVHLGTDLDRQDLLDHYDAVLYATGAAVDRRLDIPGEDLPGSHSATEFVSWYSGHPDAPQPFALDAESVVVLGVGNVAVDVARVLARTPAELVHTDMPGPVLDALAGSAVREIHVVGRRGAGHARFTTKELRELGELADAEVVIDPAEFAAGLPGDPERHVRSNLAVMADWAHTRASSRARTIRLRFWLRPAEIVGRGRVEGLAVERTRLDGDGRLHGTGEIQDIPAQLVLRAVGYRSLPLPGVPFDPGTGTVPNADGRVTGEDGRPLPGEYVAGWLGRGPTGVVGTNKKDAAATVASLLADADGPHPHRARSREPLADLLRSRGADPVDHAGWLRIDAAERAAGAAGGRDRTKLTDWAALRRLGGAAGAVQDAGRRDDTPSG